MRWTNEGSWKREKTPVRPHALTHDTRRRTLGTWVNSVLTDAPTLRYEHALARPERHPEGFRDFADPEWAATAHRPHDPGLSPDGVGQARQLGLRATMLDIDRILSSPFLRAVQTAHSEAEAIDEPIFMEPGLGEW